MKIGTMKWAVYCRDARKGEIEVIARFQHIDDAENFIEICYPKMKNIFAVENISLLRMQEGGENYETNEMP